MPRKKVETPHEILARADHVIFTGKGKLKGMRGLILDVSYLGQTPASIATVLFNTYDPDLSVEEMTAKVQLSNLKKYEPKLAYPAIHKDEESVMLFQRWDITAAWKLITIERPVATIGLTYIDSFYDKCMKENDLEDEDLGNGTKRIHVGLITVDKDAAMSDSTRLDIPIIMINIQKTYFPIDGRHRLYKAYHTRKELKAYILNEQEAKLIEC